MKHNQEQQKIRSYRAARDTLPTILDGNCLNFAELACLLYRVSNIHNDRPLAVTKKYSDVDVYQPITLNLLLLGRCSTTLSSPNLDGDLLKRISYVKDLEDTWWKMYYRQVFFNHLPYINDKAAKNHINLEVGDVCLAFYDNKMSKGDYRKSSLMTKVL